MSRYTKEMVTTAVDRDQDLLDRLDRQETAGALGTVLLAGALGAVAGIVTYFTLRLHFNVSGEVAIDAAMLVFIASAVCLAISNSGSDRSS